MATTISLHPLLDNLPSSASTTTTTQKEHSLPSLPITLSCHCPPASSSSPGPVKVLLNNQILHNHACGCSKCWKPSSALFSIVGVVPSSSLSVEENGEKLEAVDKTATIQRWKCRECGVHLYGRIEREHPFRGLDFVHGELALGSDGGKGNVEFAAFVSSIIEGGFEPNALVELEGKEGEVNDGVDGKEKGEGKGDGKGVRIKQVRDRLRDIFGEKVYDCLSPGLMDVIAEWEGRRSGKLKAVL